MIIDDEARSLNIWCEPTGAGGCSAFRIVDEACEEDKEETIAKCVAPVSVCNFAYDLLWYGSMVG